MSISSRNYLRDNLSRCLFLFLLFYGRSVSIYGIYFRFLFTEIIHVPVVPIVYFLSIWIFSIGSVLVIPDKLSLSPYYVSLPHGCSAKYNDHYVLPRYILQKGVALLTPFSHLCGEKSIFHLYAVKLTGKSCHTNGSMSFPKYVT